MALVTGNKNERNSIISPTPQADPPAPVNTVSVTDVDFKSTFVDTAWTPRNSLLTHIEGASWVVDYYSQVITTDSNLSGQQMTASPTYQSYKKIKGLEMKVASPLTTSQDSETKVMQVSGSSQLFPFIIPNEGDMFVADIGEGKLGLFRVSSSLKKSIFKEACYEIAYELDTDDLTKINDLDIRAVQTYYYHKNYLTYGQNPLIIKDEVDTLIDLEKQFSIVLQQYLKRFFSHEFKTLMVPAQSTTVYDHFVVDYMLSQFSSETLIELQYLRKLNLDDDEVMKSDNLWTALKRKEVAYLNTAFTRSGLVSAQTFTGDPVLQGIRYSGFQNVVYPADPTLCVDGIYRNNLKALSLTELEPSPVVPGMNSAMVRAINLRNKTTDVGDIIYPVTQDDYYVLSENFYKKTLQQSVLEDTVWRYLEGREVDKAQLLDVSKQYHLWGIVEQFYYLPIILTLMRAAVRGY